jgi:phage N-6-adenine-methyltransferase
VNRIKGTSTPPGKKDEWRTHLDLFKALDSAFSFSYDFAATRANALAPRYFTRERSALGADNWWTDPDAPPCGFLNPPFSLLKLFMIKAREQIGVAKQLFGYGTIVILCPADKPETEWWRTGIALDEDGIARNEVRYLYPRLPYMNEEGILKTSPHFPSALVIMRCTPWNYTRWVDWRTYSKSN